MTDWTRWNGVWPAFPAGQTPAGPAADAALPRQRELIAAIAAYRRHPFQRDAADMPVLWREHDTVLRDYGGGRRPMLFVPSLINRAYVLDLTAEHSMLRWLAARGVRPLLLDWGWPGPAERRFGLTDYIAGRLDRAIAAATQAAAAPVLLAGYCMGGLLALAAALRRTVAGLALLATPWDFHAPSAELPMRLAAGLPAMESAMALSGTLPVDALQAMFALIEPDAVSRKFLAFGRLDPAGPEALHFVALEDWLNDGVPLPAPVARDCIGGWYGANTPARGEWLVAGLPVDPRALDIPCFVAVPGRDRIVPPESAATLATLIPGAVLHRPRAGHVGMVAGARAETELWQPLLEWATSRS